MKATTPQQVIKAMLWLYENKIEHTTGVWFRDRDNHKLYFDQVLALGDKNTTVLIPSAVEKIQCACLSGCLHLVEATLDIKNQVEELMTQQLQKETARYVNFVDWNDEPTRNKEQVLDFLRRILKG